MLMKLKKYQFLFSELVKRDFTLKYKRTVLGMLWSVLNPLLQLLVMWMVFSHFFRNNTEHYVIYLFAGNLVFSYFNEATSSGMTSLLENSGIFTKVNVPKYLFLLSKNIAALISFGLTILVFFAFCLFDKITFSPNFIFLLYPILWIVVFNIGIGLVLSAAFIFFRDLQYLWGIFTMLLMYLSAIFYTVSTYSYRVQCMFFANPLYPFIYYFRSIVINGKVPSIWLHLLIAFYSLAAISLGGLMYKKYNHEFLYYV